MTFLLSWRHDLTQVKLKKDFSRFGFTGFSHIDSKGYAEDIAMGWKEDKLKILQL